MTNNLESFIRIKWSSPSIAVGDLQLVNVDWGQMILASDALSKEVPTVYTGVADSLITLYFAAPGSAKYEVESIGVSKEQLIVASHYLRLEGERYLIAAVEIADQAHNRELMLAEQRRLELPQ